MKSLQVPYTQTLGWLLWSTKSMDRNTLIDDVKSKTGINIGLRWRGIASKAINEKYRTPTEYGHSTSKWTQT